MGVQVLTAHSSWGWGQEGFPAEDSVSRIPVAPWQGWGVSTLTWFLPPLQVTCSPRETPSHHPTPELKIRTKGYRRESVRTTSPSTGPRRTPEPPGSAEGRGVFPCRECERYRPLPRRAHATTRGWPTLPPLL